MLFCGYATIDVIVGKKHWGGAAGILSINASKLGMKSYLCSVLSKDMDGKRYVSLLRSNKVNLDSSDLTAVKLPRCIINRPHGHGTERDWIDNGVNRNFRNLTLPSEQLNEFDGVFLVNAQPDFAENISRSNTKRNICYVPGPQAALQNDYIRSSVLGKTYALIGNEEEEPSIFKLTPFKFGVEYIVITKADKGGVVHLRNGKTVSFMGNTVPRVVDTTGAGDNFSLGFGSKIIAGDSVLNAVEYGRKLAKEIIQKQGGIL